MARLGKRVVDSVKIAKGRKQAFVWDDAIAGFGVRATAGGKSFLFVYRDGRGRKAAKRWVTIGRYGAITVDQARAIAKEMAGAVAKGVDPAKRRKATAADAMTVAALIELWADEEAHLNSRTGARRKPRNVEGDVSRLRAHIVPTLGRLRLGDLTRASVEKARNAISRGDTATKDARGRTKDEAGRPLRVATGKLRGRRSVRGGDGTAGRTIRTFSTVCGFAQRRGLLASNPCKGVKLAPIGRRERVLSAAEIAALAKALDLCLTLTTAEIAALCDEVEREPDETDDTTRLNPHAVTQLRLLLATGARREEVQSMRWADVDMDGGVWRISDDKGRGGGRPLSRFALAILAGLERRAGSPWVFPRANGEGFYTGLPRAWRRSIRPLAKHCAARVGATFGDDVTLHAIRHSYATTGALLNANAGLLQSVLGHRSVSTTLRYTHVAVAPAQAAADLIVARLTGQDMRGAPAEIIPLGERRATAAVEGAA